MRIMIVDDEVIIRTGLCTVIDWKELGMELLPPAASAEEALERIPTEKPHIVLTDIRMPGMDGIELSKEIKKLLPETEIIILTGYDDFAYAQQALREGVTDYLLKTSGPEEIIQAALKSKQKIISNWEALRQETEQTAALRNQMLEHLLHGQVDAIASTSQILSWFEQKGLAVQAFNQPQSMQVVHVTATGWGSHHLASLLLGATENMLSELLPGVTLLKQDRIVLVTKANSESAGKNALERACHRIRETLKCTVFAAIGCTVESYEQLHLSNDEAQELFLYRGILGDSGVYAFDEIRDRAGGRVVCSEKEEDELAAILMSNNATQLRYFVNRIVHEAMTDPQATPQTLRAFLQSVIIAGHRWLERARGGRTLEAAPPIAELLETDPHPEDEVFKLLASIMGAFHDYIADHRHSYIYKAIAYIRHHLDQNVNLQQVAKFVHLNPNHFSEVFKRETGQSYTEFVTRERMELAARILKTSDLKVSEVAGKVGYEDIKYFGQQFKKYTGQTPSEFRQS